MRKLLLILFVFISFVSVGQDFRSTDWKTEVVNVQYLGVDTFKFDSSPTDFNDKGAIERLIGGYFVDFVDRAFKIIDSDATTITVVDLSGENTAPQTNQIGRVYQSVLNGDERFGSIGGVDVSVLDELSRWRGVARNNELFARAIDSVSKISLTSPVSYLDFDTTLTSVERKRARLYYDKERDNLVFYDANKDVSLDIGKELWIDVYNPSTDTIFNGKCIVFQGNGGSHPSVKLAQANLPMNISSRIGLAPQDILPYTYGRMTIVGEVRDYDTRGMTTGQKLFISSTTEGDLTPARPEFPNYRILVATVDSVGEFGSVNVNVIGTPSDITGNITNGAFNEDFDFKITSDGTTVTGTLTDDEGNGYLTTKFSDGLDTINLPASISIPQGTSTNPQFSYVYLEKSTKKLAVSTSYWSELEHIPVATIVIRTAAQVQVAGAIRNQNVNNHLASSNGMGGLDHIRKRIRILYCVYESGCDITVNADDFTTTSGSAWQMHLQPFDAQDLSTGGAYVVNDFTAPYTVVNSLSEMLEDASGNTLKNKEYSIVVWGVQNSTDAPDQLMINLPTSTYNSVTDAINDADGYTNYSIPRNFRGVGVLFYRLTFSNSNGVWSIEDTEDLRGTIPSNVAGGGTGGAGGIESFLQLIDSPSSYVGAGGNFVTVSSSETALEFTPKSSVQLTELDSSGFELTASQITDFDTEVSSNTSVVANTAKRSYPIGDETKLDGIESGAQVNPTTLPTSSTWQDVVDNGTAKITTNMTSGGTFSVEGFDGDGIVNSISDANIEFNTMMYLANPAQRISFGYLSSDYGYIQGVSSTNIARPIYLNPYGGNVNVGGLISGVGGTSSEWNSAYIHSQLTTGNPHSVTKSDVGLSSVENAAASTLYEPIFSKNTGFNKNFGTVSGTVLEGRTFGTAANNNTGDFDATGTASGLMTTHTTNHPIPTVRDSRSQIAGTYSTDIHSNITALNAVLGTNTGDQTIPTGTDYIENQTSTTQTAGFDVSGSGTLGGSLTAVGVNNTGSSNTSGYAGDGVVSSIAETLTDYNTLMTLANPAQRISFGYLSSDRGYIQGVSTTPSARRFSINPFGGVVNFGGAVEISGDLSAADINASGDIGATDISCVDVYSSYISTGTFKVWSQFYDGSGGAGTNGQVLSSTGTGTKWIDMTGGGGGSVVSVAAGNGMSFGTITTTGSVSLATPLSITASSTNNSGNVGSGHSHALGSNSIMSTHLNSTLISGLGGLYSGLSSTDELMISDAGTLRRMDVSVLQDYMQDNLNFGSGGNPAGSDNQVQFNDNGSFGASSSFTYDGYDLKVTSGKVQADAIISSSSAPEITMIDSDSDDYTISSGNGYWSIFNETDSEELISFDNDNNATIENNTTIEGTASFESAISKAILLSTANVTLGDSHHTVVNNSGTSRTYTLPTSSTSNKGREYRIVNRDTLSCTVSTYTTIYGVSSTTIPANKVLVVQSSGGGWVQVNNY